MNDGIIVLCRFMDVDIEVMEKIVLELEKKGIIVAPVVHPIKCPLDFYDWSKRKYNAESIVDFLKNTFKLNMFENKVLIVALTSSIVELKNTCVCDSNGRVCLVSGESFQNALSSILKCVLKF